MRLVKLVCHRDEAIAGGLVDGRDRHARQHPASGVGDRPGEHRLLRESASRHAQHAEQNERGPDRTA